MTFIQLNNNKYEKHNKIILEIIKEKNVQEKSNIGTNDFVILKLMVSIKNKLKNNFL